MTNETKYYLRGVAGIFAGLGICGGVLTAYYADLGFTTRQIASFSTSANIVQVIIYIASIFIADRIKNIKKVTAWLSLGSILPCLALLPFSITGSNNTSVAYILYFIASCISNLFIGLSGLLMYRLPYLIVDMREFAKLENVNSIISNILSVGSKVLLTIFTAIFATRQIMTTGMLLGMIFCVLQVVIILSMKTNKEIESETPGTEKKNVFSLEKLRKKEISYFHIPNFLRGISQGAMTMVMVICMAEISDDATLISGLATIMAVSSISGSLIYQALRKHVRTVLMFFGASIMMFVFMPIMLVGNNATVFCIFLFLTYIGYYIISASGAVYATEIVGYHDIGTYTSVRLIAIMLGGAAACQGIAVAMDYVPTILILFACGACQLISGIMFYRYDVKYQKNK